MLDVSGTCVVGFSDGIFKVSVVPQPIKNGTSMAIKRMFFIVISPLIGLPYKKNYICQYFFTIIKYI